MEFKGFIFKPLKNLDNDDDNNSNNNLKGKGSERYILLLLYKGIVYMGFL